MRAIAGGIIASILLILILLSCTIEAKKGQNVIERGLVNAKEVYAREILKEHKKYSKEEVNHKNFKGETLAYVTPWNTKGYDIAKLFASKFTYISPVWYQITISPTSTSLRGQHDVDQSWISDIRSNNNEVKLTPRFLFEGWGVEQYRRIFSDRKEVHRLVQLLFDEVLNNKYEGVVLDMGYLVPAHIGDTIFNFFRELSKKFKSNNLIIILVIPPSGARELFTESDFLALYDFVDRFQMMTYDYPSLPRGNAPLPWVTKSVLNLLSPSSRAEGRSHKLMIGLNFYGRRYHLANNQQNPILGEEFIEILNTHKPVLQWLPSECEHFFEYSPSSSESYAVYYPTLQYLKERLDLSETLNVGVGIWEVGQGLDYFYDLL